MSSLLKEAIVDAKALRESALKNAETSIIQKYSGEVKETLDKLLEQDELGADPSAEQTTSDENIVDNVPLAATDNLSEEEGDVPEKMTKEGEEVAIAIDLDALQEAVAALESELNEDSEEEISEDQEEIDLSEEDLMKTIADVVAELSTGDDLDVLDEADNDKDGDGDNDFADIMMTRRMASGESEEEARKATRKHNKKNESTTEELEEEIEITEDDDDDKRPGSNYAAETSDTAGKMEAEAEEDRNLKMEEGIDADALVNAIMEKLTVDMGADLAGWAGRSSDDMKYEIEKELAHRRSTDVEEEMTDLKKAQEELVFENKQLTEKLSQYEGVVGELQENLQDVNLSNARLLYTNRVLRNTSLNERQKEKIVEAISNAGSVTEARTIFDTLQSTVEAKPKRSPQSLSEAIGNKRSSVIRATRQESTNSDPFQERMKRLAGIK